MPSVFSHVYAGFRALRRDWHGGELRLLILALITAVAAVGSVSFLADRVGGALTRDAGQMLGGDLVIQSGDPFPDSLVARAHAMNIETAHTIEFPSMVAYGDASQLVSVKAVSANYPLRGELRLQDLTLGRLGGLAAGIPPSGAVWADPRLLGLLQVQAGGKIDVGDTTLNIAGVIAHEPDRSLRFVNVAPRVLMRADDLTATGLLGPGSRVTHRLLLAGEPAQIAAYEHWLTQRLTPGQRILSLQTTRPELQRTLDRGHQFLSLVALLTVLLAGVAVALGTRRFCLRHQDGVAIMRCLGMSKRTLAWTFCVEFLALALMASFAGLVLAYLIHFGLVELLGAWLDIDLPPSGWGPVWKGLMTAFLLLLGFALPPLWRLRRVPPLRVLRRDAGGLADTRRSALITGAAVSVALVLFIADDGPLGIRVAGGFALAFAAFALIAALLVRIAGAARHLLGGYPLTRFSLAGMSRRRALTVTQVCALSMGMAILLLLAITRTDLLKSWQSTVPIDAPNTFLVNIQPDQRDAVSLRLRDNGLQSAELVPMVRARLTAVNGRDVTPEMYSEERAQSMVNREFNLSYREALPASNQLSKGRWLDPDKAEASIESGLAKTLSLEVGDTLTFDFAGQAREVRIVGLREVKWDSFEVNFFALLSESVLRDAPASYITSIHLPEDSAAFVRDLLSEFPNITVFDIDAILLQVRTVLDQVILAVQLLFLFTVAAGVTVLIAALLATRSERMLEVALLRTLGASAAQLRGALRIELVILGAVSGLIAATAAQLIAHILATQVFEFELSLSWWPWVAGVLAGTALALAGGRLALKGVLASPPLTSLRASQ